MRFLLVALLAALVCGCDRTPAPPEVQVKITEAWELTFDFDLSGSTSGHKIVKYHIDLNLDGKWDQSSPNSTYQVDFRVNKRAHKPGSTVSVRFGVEDESGAVAEKTVHVDISDDRPNPKDPHGKPLGETPSPTPSE